MTRAAPAVVVLILFPLVACTRPTVPNAQVVIETEVTPQPPRVGLATVAFKLRDATGKPVTGAHATLEGNMSHPGMTPVFADVREIGPGDYRGPLTFSMAGDWVVAIRVILADGQKLERQVEVKGVRGD